MDTHYITAGSRVVQSAPGTDWDTMIRYGIIGSGMMGQEHIRNIQLLKDTQVTALCEPDEGMAERSLSLVPDATRVTEIDALPFDDLDCLVIASPNFMHTGQLQALSKHRHLPVLVEKPLSTQPDEQSLVEAFARDYQAPVWVGMEYRYMPPITAFVEQAAAATGGIRMFSIREHRFPFLQKVNDWNRFNRYSGGTLVEKCCHFFDMMRLVIQSEPVRVMASAAQDVNHLDERYGGDTPDILDNAFVIVDFENGARGLLDLCMFAEGSRYEQELTAVGSNGKIECHVPGPRRFWPESLGEPPIPQIITSPRHAAGTAGGPKVQPIPVDPVLLTVGDHNGATYFQHLKFQRTVRGEQTPEVTLQDGWRAVAMGMAAQSSAETGQSVEIQR